MKFADIPQMSQPGYTCDHLLYMLPAVIEKYQNEPLCPLNIEPDFQLSLPVVQQLRFLA